MNKRKLGAAEEEKAALYIKSRGGSIIDRNFRCRMGEIDIIARDDDTICFIEVKYRKNIKKGFPAEAVGGRKQFTICRVSDYYRMKKGLSEDGKYRFDVISMTDNDTEWIKNAFLYMPY